MTSVDQIWYGCRLATLAPLRPGLGLVEDGMIAAVGGRIAYAGPAADAPSALDAKQRINCEGRWITPGLIDCHTHLVYGGNRASEFEQRLLGVSYEQIARAGGGIQSTVRATRAASDQMLAASAETRLRSLTAEGVTTIEIKSGYGLDLRTELRTLAIARALPQTLPISVKVTYLGLHALPAEFAGDRAAFVRLVSG